MKRETMTALGVAVLLGLVAVYLANVFLVSTERGQAVKGTTQVAVAAIPMGYGSDLTRDRVRFVAYPSNAVPAGSFSRPTQLFPGGQKRVALMPIAPNEPILSSKISGAGRNASIASLLPEGKRAAAVRINDVSGVAGFVQPNDSVDVLVTRQIGDGSQQVTDVLLQNVRVIALDQNATGADGKPSVARTATLEVDQLAAQKLALAQQIGSLSLVLRKPGENQDNPVVETVSLNDLRYSTYGGVQYPAAARIGAFGAAPTPPAAPRRVVNNIVRRPAAKIAATTRRVGSSVEIVRGTTRTSYEVGANVN